MEVFIEKDENGIAYYGMTQGVNNLVMQDFLKQTQKEFKVRRDRAVREKQRCQTGAATRQQWHQNSCDSSPAVRATQQAVRVTLVGTEIHSGFFTNLSERFRDEAARACADDQYQERCKDR